MERSRESAVWANGSTAFFSERKRSLRLEMGTEEFVHQDATFDANSEVHAYGQRMWPNGVVEQGQLHGSFKAPEVA